MKTEVMVELTRKWRRNILDLDSQILEEGNKLQEGFHKGKKETLESCKEDLETLISVLGD